MNRVKNPLFLWSLVLAMLTGVLARGLLGTASPLAEMSLGLQWVAAILLSLLPVTGIVLGVISWKRRELSPGWIIVVLALNALQFVLVFLRLSLIASG